MRPYFTRERFGRPQFLAGLLLLAFWRRPYGWCMPSCARRTHLTAGKRSASAKGGSSGTAVASRPLLSWTRRSLRQPCSAAATAALIPNIRRCCTCFPRHRCWRGRRISASDSAAYWRWLPRIPFLACGLFLGASLWYVARRLCGNTGGFVALTFYCFSPSLIQASAVWHTEPEIVAAWGAFGTIFTAIAVAHTLYAPREVVLWNWRRIVLLGVSLAIAVGSQFSLIVLVPMALGFLLYVAPVRRQAGFVIWIAACAVGFVLLFAVYFFHAHAFAESMRHAEFWGATWRGFTVPGSLQAGRAAD